jgi:hypothetical protein
MEEFEKKLFTSQDSIGLFITLKLVKEAQHGDKSTIVKIKTALKTYSISKELNDDGEACSTFKIHFCEDPSQMKKFVNQVLISYYRLDGKPVETTLFELFKVSHNVKIQQFSTKQTCP